MSRCRSRAKLLFAAVGGLALAAEAVLPPPERVAGAIAEVNRAAGRATPVRIQVEVQLEEGPLLAGVLISHPARGAVLEVIDPAGSVERHGLQGGEYTMMRDGLPQQVFHRLLPPLFLLQAASGVMLREQLRALGADARVVGLGRLEDRDCYVLGGRGADNQPGGGQTAVSLWSDARTHEPLRVFTREGIEYRLGPEMLFEPMRLPAWIEILEPGGFRARLELRSAEPVSREARPAAGAEAASAPHDPRDGTPTGGVDRAIGE